jgi:hypothetical protein
VDELAIYAMLLPAFEDVGEPLPNIWCPQGSGRVWLADSEDVPNNPASRSGELSCYGAIWCYYGLRSAIRGHEGSASTIAMVIAKDFKKWRCEHGMHRA